MMAITPPSGDVQFDSATGYRKAWHYFNRRGRVMIANGYVTLLNHRGEHIASSPVALFSVPKQWWNLGNGTYVVFANGAKYNLSLRSAGADVAVEAYGPVATAALGEPREAFVAALCVARAANAPPAAPGLQPPAR
jgi:hypothetical protein